MKVFVTACSASKDPSQGLVPAFKRYVSARIRHVRELAERERSPFYILSGKFGLLAHDEMVPWYDHLLVAEEVPDLAQTIAAQVDRRQVTAVTYFTQSLDDHPLLRPYSRAIETGCELAAIALDSRVLGPREIADLPANWDAITESAAEARMTFIANRGLGEERFRDLRVRFPADGMVAFQLGATYEAVGEYELATSSYLEAERLFPLDRWKREAREAHERVVQQRAEGGTIAEASRHLARMKHVDDDLKQRVTAAIGNLPSRPAACCMELRKCLEVLVARIPKPAVADPGDLLGRIKALEYARSVPKVILGHMHTIRTVGNAASHEDQKAHALSLLDAYPAVMAFVAILGWWDSKPAQR